MSLRVREIIMANFEFVRVPIMILGILATLGCLFFLRDAVSNDAFVLSLAMWALAASRLAVIALLDLTFVPAINVIYLAPTSFLFTAASLFAIGAWFQVRRDRRQAALRSFAEAAHDGR